jgi:hypothetical protein
MSTTAGQLRQAERFARYCELRDEGAYSVDAGREIGLADGTRRAYERAYKRLRGIPRAKSAY